MLFPVGYLFLLSFYFMVWRLAFMSANNFLNCTRPSWFCWRIVAVRYHWDQIRVYPTSLSVSDAIENALNGFIVVHHDKKLVYVNINTLNGQYLMLPGEPGGTEKKLKTSITKLIMRSGFLQAVSVSVMWPACAPLQPLVQQRRFVFFDDDRQGPYLCSGRKTFPP